MQKPRNNKTLLLKNKSDRTESSKKWLLRKLNDPFVQKAKDLGYRSRAAFKLLEIETKFKLLKPGAIVIDLGAAPGGWSQVAVEKVKAHGKVLAIDLQAIDPIPQVDIMQLDFMTEDAPQIISDRLGGSLADVILSDMAAPSCGMSDVDHIRIMALLEAVCEFSFMALKPGGSIVAKVLRGGAEAQLLAQLKKAFRKVSHFKPNSSRKESAEMYLVAVGFRGK